MRPISFLFCYLGNLGQEPARRPNLKPLQVLNSVKNGTVDDAKLQGLEMILLEALQPAQ